MQIGDKVRVTQAPYGLWKGMVGIAKPAEDEWFDIQVNGIQFHWREVELADPIENNPDLWR